MKKTYLNIIFQLIALIIILKVFFFDEIEIDKFLLLKTNTIFLLLIFSIIIKLLITYLFFNIINIFLSEKIGYLDVTSVHLQGALVNQVLPGLGFIFRYYKFKLYSNISILVYSISQTIWSINSFLVYLIAAGAMGFLIIVSYTKLNLLLIFGGIALTLIVKFRYNFYDFLKKLILKYKKSVDFINNLRDIKKLILSNKIKFFLIFIGFIILIILECLAFYVALNFFGLEISFLNSNYIWITSTLITALTLINFFGLFEIIIALSAALIVPEINNVLIFAVNLRIINLISLALIIIKSSILKKIVK